MTPEQENEATSVQMKDVEAAIRNLRCIGRTVLSSEARASMRADLESAAQLLIKLSSLQPKLVMPVALGSVNADYDKGWADHAAEVVRLNASKQLEQDDSLNMEPEGANAYLVVDPDDNYHICYVVRSKDQALQHASGGLLAFGPITQE